MIEGLRVLSVRPRNIDLAPRRSMFKGSASGFGSSSSRGTFHTQDCAEAQITKVLLGLTGLGKFDRVLQACKVTVTYNKQKVKSKRC